MQRVIADIKNEIAGHEAKSAWEMGVRAYARELFADYVDGHHLPDTARIGKLTKEDLLNGARDWEQYSWGGCSLIYDEDICRRLCPPSTQRKYSHGARQPSGSETWLDWQTRALGQAAWVVLRAVNKRN